MKKFFLSNALEFGMEGIRVEVIGNTGGKYRDYTETFKVTDRFTGVEYFIRSGEMGLGWCTYSTGNRSRGVKQYNVMSFEGQRKLLGLSESVQCVERHINRKRAK